MTGKKVLIVHRDPTDRAFLKRGLEQKGLAVLAAAGTAQALNILRIENVAVVFLDLRLPDMACGFQALESYRAARPGIPIHALADHPAAPEIQAARAQGLRGYYVKPFTLGALANAARTALEPPAGGTAVIAPDFTSRPVAI